MKTEIAEEMSSFVSIDQFIQMWDHATEQPHGFLMVDFSARDACCRFRSGFDQLMILSGEDTQTHVTQQKSDEDKTKESDTPSSSPKEGGSGRKASLIHPGVPLSKLGIIRTGWATIPGAKTKRGGANTWKRFNTSRKRIKK